MPTPKSSTPRQDRKKLEPPRNTKGISTGLLLRVLYSLGYSAKIKFQKAA
jgi:hypothetical protein